MAQDERSKKEIFVTLHKVIVHTHNLLGESIRLVFWGHLWLLPFVPQRNFCSASPFMPKGRRRSGRVGRDGTQGIEICVVVVVICPT